MTQPMPERRPYILSFVGENENGILLWWTERILQAFAPFGFDYQIVDLMDAGWREHLAGHLAGGMPAFCFAFQGFGMGLKLNGENYWSLNGIPFIAYMGDAPYHAPALHAAEGPGLYYIYGCIDFIETYRDYLDGAAYASFVQFGYPENPHCDRVPWDKREHAIVFAKTGVDPRSFRAEWAQLPGPLRKVVEDGAEIMLGGAGASVAAACAAAFKQRLIHYGQQNEFFLFACSSVDRYVRAVHAERMVQALLPLDALIVGNWSHLDRSNARARFAAPVHALALDELYADAKIVVNTLPSVRAGSHERIVAGQFAKAAVVSDTTPFLDRDLSECPSFVGIDIDGADVGNAVADATGSTLADPEMPTKIAIAAAVAHRRHSMDGFIIALLDHLQLDAQRRSKAHFAFPPRLVA